MVKRLLPLLLLAGCQSTTSDTPGMPGIYSKNANWQVLPMTTPKLTSISDDGGCARVAMTVNEYGEAEDVQVLASELTKAGNKALIKASRAWRFHPTGTEPQLKLSYAQATALSVKHRFDAKAIARELPKQHYPNVEPQRLEVFWLFYQEEKINNKRSRGGYSYYINGTQLPEPCKALLG
ncbi:hypothetical protein [Gallaecimonas sp. GXIMD4217]|uniref:energy transducer TonB n=1 Tax=Gallaecimonas sp. GXIMD4217 TaxID=3131927 RepID=UPI00311B0CB1